MSTIIETPEDKHWLRTTHLKGLAVGRFALAVLVGNEDYPKRIVLYRTNHFKAEPAVYEPDDSGKYRLRPRRPHQMDNQE